MGALARNIETLELFMQAACASPDAPTQHDDVWEDVLPPTPFRPLPEVDLRDVRVLLTPQLPGVATDLRVADAIREFGARVAAAGAAVEQGAGPEFDNRQLFRAHKLFSSLCGSR